MKKTVVEWYGKALVTIFNEYMNGNINDSDLHQNLLNAMLQAKEMHRQQIMEAYNDGMFNWDSEKDDEQYYNETYGRKTD